MSLQSLRRTRTSWIKRHGSFGGFIAGAALLGFLAQFQWIGDIVIVIFTVVAFVRQLPARTMYIAALLTLGIASIAVMFSNWIVAQNFTAYSFLLFVIALMMTVLELKREPRTSE